ncbi:uncharacterized protein [Eurosta solidaginis]|uniref:uncharacterized protein isoform X2 n=1 Tax=Eurosta solidaginis TaxID=178769 RepID=UPI003530F7C6
MTATLRYRGDKNNLIELAKNLDAFKKVPEKYTETTEIGGTLSLLSRLLIIFLIYNEVCYYREASLVYQFEPDIDLDGKVQMHVDITVAMPCRSLSGVDLMDETQQDVFAYGTLQREGTWWALPEGERLQFERMQHMNTFLREEYHSVADILFKNIIKSKEVHAKSLQNVKSLPEEQYDACRLHGTLGLNKDCPSRIMLFGSECIKSKNYKAHNHDNQEALYKELKFLNNVKTKCARLNEKPTENNCAGSIRNIFVNTSMENQNESKNIVFNKIQRSLQYIANKNFKNSPKTPAEVQEVFQDAVYDKFGYSKLNGNKQWQFFNICYQEEDYAYCVFCSERTVELMKECIPVNSKRNILIDGTFSVLPLGSFKQLLILHCEYFGSVFPFLFVLMTKKSLKAYQHLFSYIQRSIIDLSQATFITDYETGLRSAIEKSFPDSKMFGCWFHYCQALRRFITMKDKRLAQYIRQNKEASRIYHKFLSLSLLPGMHISDSFQLLTEDLGKLNALDRFKSFIKYFENQWMQKIDPHNFSVFDSEIRTTSAIEAYNGVIGKSIPKKATFFKFVAFLQMQEFEKVAGVLHLIGNYQPFVDIFEDHFLFDLRPITVNFTHRINRLSFGQYSGRIVQPLEGDEIVLADADTVIQYFLKIVPTEIHNTFTTIDTYQYSVTENVRQLDSAKNSYGSPGIYIKYDWSALKIIVRADHDNLVQFIIRLCSIIAGIIVISGILNTILVSLQRVTINTLAPPLIQQQSLKDTIRRSSSYDNAHHREVTKTPESNAINVDLLHDCAQAVNTKLISNNLINTANTMANSISLLDASIPYTTSAAATYVPIAGDDKQEK